MRGPRRYRRERTHRRPYDPHRRSQTLDRSQTTRLVSADGGRDQPPPDVAPRSAADGLRAEAMTREQANIQRLFGRLTHSPLQPFPSPRGKLIAPNGQGVYVIYSPRWRVVHVGRTPSGTGGIRQRLGNHLHNASSFTARFLDGHGAELRRGYTFRCLVAKSRRLRALLEAYAIGRLCPAHIGLGSLV